MNWEILRIFSRRPKLSPRPISGPDSIPQFIDTDNGVTFLGPETAARYLMDWSALQGRPFVPMNFVYSKEGENSGLHCELTVSHEEFGQNQLLIASHATLIIHRLFELEMLSQGESACMSYTPIITKDGRGVIKIDRVTTEGKKVNFEHKNSFQ